MRIGFIGAGKVGCSLGQYFRENGFFVSGYCSRSLSSAEEAASYVDSKVYFSYGELAAASDLIFLTVPDKAIGSVWNLLSKENLSGRIICHCSGALSSFVFSGIGSLGAYAASVHPLLAVSAKTGLNRELSQAFFTIEGDPKAAEAAGKLLDSCGNRWTKIDASAKPLYHAAAAMASNLMVGLCDSAFTVLEDAGFSREDARTALTPLLVGNLSHVIKSGPEEALTGPIERGDIETVRTHLACLTGEEAEVYRILSRRTLAVAKRRHPDFDYRSMEELLQ